MLKRSLLTIAPLAALALFACSPSANDGAHAVAQTTTVDAQQRDCNCHSTNRGDEDCTNGCCNATLGCIFSNNNGYNCGPDCGTCSDCVSQGQYCKDHMCVTCGAGNCDGCCTRGDAPYCVGGTANSSCGTGGITCVDCYATSQNCWMGQCQACGANGHCATGCCSEHTPGGFYCETGTSNNECGTGGAACVDCRPGTCVDHACQGGTGGAGGGCGTSTTTDTAMQAICF